MRDRGVYPGINVIFYGHHIFLTGFTNSSDFSVANAVQPTAGGGICFGVPCDDAFVAKLDPSGSTLLYPTYLGGCSTDGGFGLAVDGDGNAYVTGRTHSTNFPTANAVQRAFGGGVVDAFVARLDAIDTLVYSTIPEHCGPYDTDEERTVLFLDFARPLPFPVSVLNEAMIWLFSAEGIHSGGIGTARRRLLRRTQ